MEKPSEPKRELNIVRLSALDAKYNSDLLKAFENRIVESEEMYPNIKEWFQQRVVPGIKSSQRTAFIGFEGENPVITAVVKKGTNSKFCHLHIGQDWQDLNLGNAFFCLMAWECRQHSKELHFTLPESLWEGKREFFESFGFGDVTKAGTQYRLFDPEWQCSAPFDLVWNAVLEKLPQLMTKFSFGGHGFDNRILMSIHPKYADEILSGAKLVEIRRKFSEKLLGMRVSLYATKPVASLVGEATITNIITGSPEEIWCQFGNMIGVSKGEFDRYVSDCTKAVAITLDEVNSFETSISLLQASSWVSHDLRPPRSYYRLGNNKEWAQAISIATMLQAQLGKANLRLSV